MSTTNRSTAALFTTNAVGFISRRKNMGVYIKGMALPKDCGSCGVREEAKCGTDYKWLVKHPDFYGTRRPDCPLIEIPTPHGRLIEDNKVVSRMVDSYANAGLHSEDYRKVCKYISQAPTILEAEGGDAK